VEVTDNVIVDRDVLLRLVVGRIRLDEGLMEGARLFIGGKGLVGVPRRCKRRPIL
jgi:hypothetical protein